MALTITSPAPGRFGPGYKVYINQSSVGPIPSDDFIELRVYTLTGVNPMVTGTVTMHGSHSVDCTAGIYRGPVFTDAAMEADVPNGSALLVQVTQFHANFSVVDNLNSFGWTWDPTGALYILSTSQEGGLSSQILAAVTRTFPTT